MMTLEKVNERIAELVNKRKSIDAEVEKLDNQMAEALAEGKDPSKIHTAFIRLDSESKAIPRALDKLKATRRELENAALNKKVADKITAIEEAAVLISKAAIRAADALDDFAGEVMALDPNHVDVFSRIPFQGPTHVEVAGAVLRDFAKIAATERIQALRLSLVHELQYGGQSDSPIVGDRHGVWDTSHLGVVSPNVSE